jgi:hypothetical protein
VARSALDVEAAAALTVEAALELDQPAEAEQGLDLVFAADRTKHIHT